MGKIIYFLEFADLNQTTSVLKKAIANVQIWREQGEDSELVIYTNVRNGAYNKVITPHKDCVTVFTPKYSDKVNLILRKIGILLPIGLQSQKECFKYLLDLNPDFIYHRTGKGNWLIRKILKCFNTVWELNSILEYELDKRNILVRYFVKNKAHNYYEFSAQTCKGLVTVTKEIADYYSNIFPVLTQKKIFVSPNAVPIKDEPLLEKNGNSNSKPQIVFIGSPNQFWHGLDLIEEFADKHNELEFHLIGFVEEQQVEGNKTYYPYLDKESYEKILMNCDVGLGTVGLFRKKMKEACPLKVREYLSYGLPVILPYFDTALSGKSLPYVLQVDGLDEHKERILDFCKKWKGKQVDIKEVAPYISMAELEEKKLTFIREIL